jgi:hypothetical protein
MRPEESPYFAKRQQIDAMIVEEEQSIRRLEGEGSMNRLEALYKRFTGTLATEQKVLDAAIRFLLSFRVAEPNKLRACLDASGMQCSVSPIHLVRPPAGSALDGPQRYKDWVLLMTKKSQLFHLHQISKTAAKVARKKASAPHSSQTAPPKSSATMTPKHAAEERKQKELAELQQKRARMEEREREMYLQLWSCFRFYCSLGEKSNFDVNEMSAKGFEAFAADVHQRSIHQIHEALPTVMKVADLRTRRNEIEVGMDYTPSSSPSSSAETIMRETTPKCDPRVATVAANAAAGAAAATIFATSARAPCEDSSQGSRLSFTQVNNCTSIPTTLDKHVRHFCLLSCLLSCSFASGGLLLESFF